MTEPLPQTQALPTEEPTVPASPPIQKPTLASLIVDKMDTIAKEAGNTDEKLTAFFALLPSMIEQVKTLLWVAIASLLFLSVAILACLLFEAILVGHVR